MHALVVCNDDPFHRNAELVGQCRAISGAGRCRDNPVDVGNSERGLSEAIAGRLRAGMSATVEIDTGRRGKLARLFGASQMARDPGR